MIRSEPETNGLNDWARAIHECGVAKGWASQEVDTSRLKEIAVEKLLLMHIEISEATEELRLIHFHADEPLEAAERCIQLLALRKMAESSTDEFEKPVGFASEIADIIIRALHLCAILGIDAEREVRAKMDYNWTREYRHGGKSC